MTTPIESLFTPEQISDLFLTYARVRRFGIGGNVEKELARAIEPLLPGVDLVTGLGNDAGELAKAVLETFNKQP